MINIHQSRTASESCNYPNGFTLIELMIVIAVIAIILTLAIPVYNNYTIRSKVAEALSVAASAKTQTTDACQSDPEIPALSNPIAGYFFGGSPYVSSILISGPCAAPVITISTQDTGATIHPTLTLTGEFIGPGRFHWTCASSDHLYVPSTCRS